jgi:hypothetical protein
MSWAKRTALLIGKEWTDFFSGKAWILVLILPLFITFLFTTIYRETDVEKYTVGHWGKLPSPVREVLSAAKITLKTFSDQAGASSALAQNKVDAVLIPQSGNSRHFTLRVTPSGYQKAVAISNSLNTALIRIYSNPGIPQFVIAGPKKRPRLDWLALPLWLIQIILTLCFLQNTAIIADEKERQTLHALLISPMTLIDYFTAKLCWSVALGIGSLMLTLFLIKSPVQIGYILTFGFLGALVYSALAICIGLLTPNALFARTMATVLYLVSSLPLMIKNMDIAWKNSLNIFPTFMILRGFEAAFNSIPTPELYLLGLGLLTEAFILLGVSYLTLQHKVDF